MNSVEGAYTYLFIYQVNNCNRAVARSNVKMRDKKERTKEGEERRENGSSTPTMGIDALIGKEEQNGKQKKEQKKETGSWSLTELP